MKGFFKILLLLFICQVAQAQQGFEFLTAKSSSNIPFKLINNLVIIPVKLNGVAMNFLLDTGVKETLLFSLEEKVEVELFNVEKIKLKGLGGQEAIEGLKSLNNTISLNGLIKKKQTIIVVLDETFNFSSSLGIPINGIIGYYFFENDLVEIDYGKKQILVHNRKKYKDKKLKKHQSFPITIEKGKPYMITQITIEETKIASKLLLDTGNSDALWLFQEKNSDSKVPTKSIYDFLGRGFSGAIFGSRAKIQNFEIGSFVFNNPLVAFPDTVATKDIAMVTDRVGAIGGEIFKRFNIVLDYKNEKIHLKKNRNFYNSFSFDQSGIVIQHTGVRLVKEVPSPKQPFSNDIKIDFGERELNVKYKFELKPIFEVVNVRINSPAFDAGLKKGDIVIAINGYSSYKYSLEKINQILKSDHGKNIFMEIERNGTLMNFNFKLKNLL